MNNIPNDVLQEIILNKVKLFTKENYFGYFSSIIIKLSHNITAFQKKLSLSISISSLQKEKIHTSWWQLITRLIFPLNKSLLYNDENENEIENENEYEPDLNPLCFEYLKSYCHKKMKQLTSLSQTERIPLKRILPMYLNLCEKQIKKEREKESGIYHLSKESLAKLKKNSFLLNKQPSFVNRTQIKFSQKNGGKNMPSVQQLEYCNSFTRLFIGDTDENSIMERYLSNMVVKKHRQLHLLNSYMDMPSMYLKRMYYKLFKKEGGKGVMDKDMINVINQFENDHKKIENFQRTSSAEKGNQQFDITKSQLLLELQTQKQKYIKKKNPKKNKRKIRNIFTSSIRKNEVSTINRDFNMNIKLGPITKIKNQNASINYNDSQIFNDILLNKKHNMNPNNNNKYTYIRKSYSLFKINNKNHGNKINRINRSSSAFAMKYNNHNHYHNILKNNSFLNENRKKKYFKNYMNNNDFFFSKA